MRKSGFLIISVCACALIFVQNVYGKRLSFFDRDERPWVRSGCTVGHTLKLDPGTLQLMDVDNGFLRLHSEIEEGRAVLKLNSRRLIEASLHLDNPRDKARFQFFGRNLFTIDLPDFPILMNLTDLSKLPPHEYAHTQISQIKSVFAIFSEDTGFIYTRKGGLIDIPHVQNHADITAYVVEKILALGPDGGSFTYEDLGTFAGVVTVEFSPPPNVPFELDGYILDLAQRISHDLGVWHEIATWFNHMQTPIFSEQHSSFAIDDVYSNLMGTYVARDAILDEELSYEAAMDHYLRKWVEFLGDGSYDNTKEALDEVAGQWWDNETRHYGPGIALVRDFSFGPEPLKPWVIESRLKSDEKPFLLAVPKVPGDYSMEIDVLSDQVKRAFGTKKEDKLLISNSDFHEIVRERLQNSE